MMREPELHACPEILASAGALVCANDPLACIAPAAGPGSPYSRNVPSQWQPVPPGSDWQPGPDPVPWRPAPDPLPFDPVPQGSPWGPPPEPQDWSCSVCEVSSSDGDDGGFPPFQGQGPFPNQPPGESYGGSRDHASTLGSPTSGDSGQAAPTIPTRTPPSGGGRS